jgi:hypothetical protein
VVVDPNELLIFKLRGMTFAPSQKPSAQAPSQKPQIQPKGTTAQQSQQAQPAKTQPKPSSGAEVAAPKGQVAPSPSDIRQQRGKMVLGLENVPEVPEAREIEEENMRMFAPQYAYSTEVQSPKGHKKFTKLEKESIEMAKGMVCVNHPWRPAYAICNYCKRPFCFADLIEYNGAFYCLEDIDKVAGSAAKAMETSFNSFLSVSSLFLFVTSALMGYFVYPQAKFLLNYIESVGFAEFLNHLTYSYGLSFTNLIIAILGIFAGAMLLTKKSRWFYLSWAVDSFILVIASYEYLAVGSPYLLAISILSFITMGTLAYSRISKVAEEVVGTSEEINWPRVETF